MEDYGTWRILKWDDCVKPSFTKSKTAIIRKEHLNTAGSITAEINTNSANIKPFYCPNCGGNSYRKVNGKIVCDYCDTEFIR